MQFGLMIYDAKYVDFYKLAELLNQSINIVYLGLSSVPHVKHVELIHAYPIGSSQCESPASGKKPNVFAFGEYSLDQNENWIVGVAARYNLFSGIDKNKNIQAAELKRSATELLTARTQQKIENLIYKSYSKAFSVQQSDALLAQNLKAAQENLRIQELSFKEDMGTATQVIDAQNMLSGLRAETALNAYKYVMSLATLLQSHGSITEFPNYIQHTNTHYRC